MTGWIDGVWKWAPHPPWGGSTLDRKPGPPRVFGRPADLVNSRAFREFIIHDRLDRWGLEMGSPSTLGWLHVHVAGKRREQLSQRLPPDVQKARAKRRIEPLVSTAGQKVHRCLFHIQRNCAELLDRIHDQPHSLFSAKRAEFLEIASEAITPLHRAHADDSCLRRQALRNVLHSHFPALVGDNVDANAPWCQLD